MKGKPVAVLWCPSDQVPSLFAVFRPFVLGKEQKIESFKVRKETVYNPNLEV